MDHKKLANGFHEDEARRSSRDWLGRISKSNQKAARSANRRAKHRANRLAFKDQDS